MDLQNEDGRYVLLAELPGVKKENLEVHVGDKGRGITIQGGTLSKSVSDSNSLEEAKTQSTEGNIAAGYHKLFRH